VFEGEETIKPLVNTALLNGLKNKNEAEIYN